MAEPPLGFHPPPPPPPPSSAASTAAAAAAAALGGPEMGGLCMKEAPEAARVDGDQVRLDSTPISLAPHPTAAPSAPASQVCVHVASIPPQFAADESIGEESETIAVDGSAGEDQVRLDSITAKSVGDEVVSEGMGGLSMEEETIAAGGGAGRLDSAPLLAVAADESISEEMGSLSLEEPAASIAVEESAGANRLGLASSPSIAVVTGEAIGELSPEEVIDYEVIGDERGELSLEEVVAETPERIDADESAGSDRLGLDSVAAVEASGHDKMNLSLEGEKEMPGWIDADESVGLSRGIDSSPSVVVVSGEAICDEKGELSSEEAVEEMPERVDADGSVIVNQVGRHSLPPLDGAADECVNKERGDTVEDGPEGIAANEGAVDSPPRLMVTTSQAVDRVRGDLSLEEGAEEMPEPIAADQCAGRNRLGLHSVPSPMAEGEESFGVERGAKTVLEETSEPITAIESAEQLDSRPYPFATTFTETIDQESRNICLDEKVHETSDLVAANESAGPNHERLDSPTPSSAAVEPIGERGNLSFVEEPEEKPQLIAAIESREPPFSSDIVFLESICEKRENLRSEEQVPELMAVTECMLNQDDANQEEPSHYPHLHENTESSGHANIELLQDDTDPKKVEDNLGVDEGMEDVHGHNLEMWQEDDDNQKETEEKLQGVATGVQENVQQAKGSADLKQLQSVTGPEKLDDDLGRIKGLESLPVSNVEIRQEEDAADLKESKKKFEGSSVSDNEGWRKGSAVLQDSTPFGENLGHDERLDHQGSKETTEDNAVLEHSPPFKENPSHVEGLENLQGLNEKTGLVEDADLEKLKEKFEGSDVQENSGWGEDNADLKGSLLFGEQGNQFENPPSCSENSAWSENAAPWNSEDKVVGGDVFENKGWDCSASLAESPGWITGLEDGAHTKEDFSSETLGKREWSEGVGNFGGSEHKSNSLEYPQRPGERNCNHYLRTGNCQYGSYCKFNHPPNRMQEKERSWYKLGLCQAAGELQTEPPQRPAWGECKMYLTTGTCKFGSACKYSHRGQYQKETNVKQVELNSLGLPLRPGEKECEHYLRTGSCKFSTNCRYHHPDSASTGQEPSGYRNGGLPEGFVSAAPQLLEMSQSSKTSKKSNPFSNVSKWDMLFPPQRTHPTSDWNEYQAPVSSSVSNSSGPTSQKVGSTQWQPQIKDYAEKREQAECPYFMKFGTCKFGDTCKYQHPLPSVFDGPASKADSQIQGQASVEDNMERQTQPMCPYFMNFGTCKYGSTCNYQHPQSSPSNGPISQTDNPIQQQAQMQHCTDQQPQLEYGTSQFGSMCNYQRPPSSTSSNATTWGESHIHPLKQMEEYPHRPGERLCSHYMKTGTCNFKSACKFHHPSPSTFSFLTTEAGPYYHHGQMDEYPQRPGQPECSYFVRFGTCKFKSACRFHHPSPSVSGGLTTEANGGAHLQRQMEYCERPGEPECPSFMKFGSCNFGAACVYHHPSDRLPSMSTCHISPNGLPLRPGQPTCFNYSRFGICKVGPLCEFDHPPDSGSSVPAADSRSGRGSLTDESEW